MGDMILYTTTYDWDHHRYSDARVWFQGEKVPPERLHRCWWLWCHVCLPLFLEKFTAIFVLPVRTFLLFLNTTSCKQIPPNDQWCNGCNLLLEACRNWKLENQTPWNLRFSPNSSFCHIAWCFTFGVINTAYSHRQKHPAIVWWRRFPSFEGCSMLPPCQSQELSSNSRFGFLDSRGYPWHWTWHHLSFIYLTQQFPHNPGCQSPIYAHPGL